MAIMDMLKSLDKLCMTIKDFEMCKQCVLYHNGNCIWNTDLHQFISNMTEEDFEKMILLGEALEDLEQKGVIRREEF